MRDLTCPFIQHGASQPVTEAPVRAVAPAPFFSNKKSWRPVDWVPSPEKTGSSPWTEEMGLLEAGVEAMTVGSGAEWRSRSCNFRPLTQPRSRLEPHLREGSRPRSHAISRGHSARQDRWSPRASEAQGDTQTPAGPSLGVLPTKEGSARSLARCLVSLRSRLCT